MRHLQPQLNSSNIRKLHSLLPLSYNMSFSLGVNLINSLGWRTSSGCVCACYNISSFQGPPSFLAGVVAEVFVIIGRGPSDAHTTLHSSQLVTYSPGEAAHLLTFMMPPQQLETNLRAEEVQRKTVFFFASLTPRPPPAPQHLRTIYNPVSTSSKVSFLPTLQPPISILVYIAIPIISFLTSFFPAVNH